MLNHVLLEELCRQRRRDVARDVARCRHAPSPRVALGRLLVAFGALVVFVGSTLDDESERKPEVTVA
jgi:hypothetical protein